MTTDHVQELIDSFPDEITQDGINMHGHLAPGIILGFKMALRALKDIGARPDDNIVLTSETTRCIPDGIQAIARYLLTHGGYHVYLRTYDVGKLSMQVTVNGTDKLRLVLDDNYMDKEKWLYAWVYLPKHEQLYLEELREKMWTVDIDAAFKAVPFKKKIKKQFKGKNVLDCPSCGESVARYSMLEHEGQLLCKTCVFFDKA